MWLGNEVKLSPYCLCGGDFGGEDFGDSKVSHFEHRLLVIQHDVLSLEIPV